jgi:hypothetical protein
VSELFRIEAGYTELKGLAAKSSCFSSGVSTVSCENVVEYIPTNSKINNSFFIIISFKISATIYNNFKRRRYTYGLVAKFLLN